MSRKGLGDILDGADGCLWPMAVTLFSLGISPIVACIGIIYLARAGIEQAATPLFVQSLAVAGVAAFLLAGACVGVGLVAVAYSLARRPVYPPAPQASFKFDNRGALQAPTSEGWEPLANPPGEIPVEIEERKRLPVIG